MTGEEVERAVEFLLQGRASSEARLGRLEGIVGQLAVTWGRSQEQLDGLREGIDQLRQQVTRVRQLVEITAESTQRNSADIDALFKLVGGIIQARDGDANRGG